jgi:signal transduction histidine kinase
VDDDGPRITAEYRGKVFDKYGQVESRAGEERHSMGLGLTFCKYAVEAHGGHIGVNSVANKMGSSFWFTLPRKGPKAAP